MSTFSTFFGPNAADKVTRPGSAGNGNVAMFDANRDVVDAGFAATNVVRNGGTTNLTVGYTVTPGTISGLTYTVDFTLAAIQKWSITGNITINEPASATEFGSQKVYITTDGSARTITLGTDVDGIGTIATTTLSLEANSKYECVITRDVNTSTMVSFTKVG